MIINTVDGRKTHGRNRRKNYHERGTGNRNIFGFKKGCDIQKITKSIKEAEINEKGLSLNEQLEIISLIKQIIVQNTKSCKDVSDFLSLVDQVEEKVKSQNKSTLGGNNEAK